MEQQESHFPQENHTLRTEGPRVSAFTLLISANGFSQKSVCYYCIHKLLTSLATSWKSGILTQEAMSFILISWILQENLPGIFLPELKHHGRDRGEMLHVASQMYN